MTSLAAGATASTIAGRIRARPDAFALAVVLVGAAAFYYVVGRGTSFFFDEWDFILHSRGNDPSVLLAPHNGHLSIAPILVYKALWSTVGLRHYGPYRLVAVALHLVCAGLLFVLLRRRVGGAAALAGAVSLLFLGRAWEDVVWPFQIGYLGSIAAGLAALLALEGRRRRGDAAAAVLLAVSLSCSGLGVPFLGGALLALLLERRSWPRLWVVVGPGVLYSAWYLAYGHNEASASNLSAVPGYVYVSLAGAVGALSGLGTGAGKVLAGVALAAAVLVVRAKPPPRDTLVPAVAVLAFWILTALARAQYHEPAAGRYLYPGAVLLLLLAGWLADGLRPSRRAAALLLGVVAVASALNVYAMHGGVAGLRATDATVRAELAAVELEGTRLPAGFQPDPVRAPQVTAGPYLAAVRDLGSPAVPAAQLPAQSPPLRAAVDEVLVRGLSPRFSRRGFRRAALPGPVVDGYGEGALAERGGCVRFRPGAGNRIPSFDVSIPSSGLVLRSAGRARLYLRRFGDEFQTESLVLDPGPHVVQPPVDASAAPWHVRIAPSAPVTACTAARAA